MKVLRDFIGRFNAKISLNENFIVKQKGRYFLLNKELKKFVRENFFYAGIYLGKVKGGKFFPSFNLLRMIAEKKANKIVVDERAAWLFICGRDIFKQGIIQVFGSNVKGDYTLIINRHGECLGFGKIIRNMDTAEGVVVKNIADIGDFLRREKLHVSAERNFNF